MKNRTSGHLLIFAVMAALLLAFALAMHWQAATNHLLSPDRHLAVQVKREDALSLANAPDHRVIAAPPEEIPPPPTPEADRYRIRNEFPEDITQYLSLYLIDTSTGEEIRLGDDFGAA